MQRLNGRGADLAVQEPYMLHNNPRHVYLILVVPRHDTNLLSKGQGRVTLSTVLSAPAVVENNGLAKRHVQMAGDTRP
jgi:hypothetical protein